MYLCQPISWSMVPPCMTLPSLLPSPSLLSCVHAHEQYCSPCIITSMMRKINSWVSFSFLYDYGAALGSPSGLQSSVKKTQMRTVENFLSFSIKAVSWFFKLVIFFCFCPQEYLKKWLAKFRCTLCQRTLSILSGKICELCPRLLLGYINFRPQLFKGWIMLSTG